MEEWWRWSHHLQREQRSVHERRRRGQLELLVHRHAVQRRAGHLERRQAEARRGGVAQLKTAPSARPVALRARAPRQPRRLVGVTLAYLLLDHGVRLRGRECDGSHGWRMRGQGGPRSLGRAVLHAQRLGASGVLCSRRARCHGCGGAQAPRLADRAGTAAADFCHRGVRQQKPRHAGPERHRHDGARQRAGRGRERRLAEDEARPRQAAGAEQRGVRRSSCRAVEEHDAERVLVFFSAENNFIADNLTRSHRMDARGGGPYTHTAVVDHRLSRRRLHWRASATGETRSADEADVVGVVGRSDVDDLVLLSTVAAAATECAAVAKRAATAAVAAAAAAAAAVVAAQPGAPPAGAGGARGQDNLRDPAER